MNKKTVVRPQYFDSSFRFYDVKSKSLKEDIWDELQNGLWRSFDIDAYLSNEEEYATNVEHKEKIRNKLVFPNLAVIEPGHQWNDEKKDTEIVFTSIRSTDGCDRRTLMRTLEKYFSQFGEEKVGVHLSGGLDSSIIMAWLRELNIPFVAIGFKSNRWEFRTERRVQEEMACYAQEAELIDIDDYPFYSHIDECPKCQSPYGVAFKDFAISREIVKRFSHYGVKNVFSGQGGDSLFVEAIDGSNPVSLAIGDEFEVCGENDMYYAPAGIRLLTPFSDINIIQQIVSLRVGQREDVSKWWARNFFSDILPIELSRHSYVADMFGLSQSGLELAKPVVESLFNETYELTGNCHFAPAMTKRFVEENIFEMEFKSYVEYAARLSVSAWIHALFRDN